MKNILLLGAGKDQLIGIKDCINLGLKIYALDGRENAEGFEFCDEHAVCDIKNPDEVEKFALKWNKEAGGIDGVIAFAVEVGESIGRCVDKLNLTGIGEKTATILTDKILRRVALDEARILQPKWAYREEKKEKLWDIFPAIVKPRNMAGARNVRIVKSYGEFGLNWDYVEEYIAGGWELSTECLIFSDKSFMSISADRNYQDKLKYAPAVLENGFQLPSRLPQPILRKVDTLIQKIIDIFNLRSCVIKLDLLIKSNQIFVIEIAPRLGGGRLSSVGIPLYCGIEYWRLALKLVMGMEILPEEIQQKHTQCVAQRYHFLPNPQSHKDRDQDFIETGATIEEAVKKAEEKVATYTKP